MDFDQFPLSMFEVDCDGTACGAGKQAAPHVHPEQNGRVPIARVIYRNGKRVRYVTACERTPDIDHDCCREG